MTRIEVFPREGINGVHFGMPRNEVHASLGKPSDNTARSEVIILGESIPNPARDGYFENEMQIFYDEKNLVEFIELSGRGAYLTDVHLASIQVFQIKVDNLLERIALEFGESFDRDDSEIPCSYTFRSLDMVLWRPFGPEDSKIEGEKPDEEDDAAYFWTISIGRKGYFAN